MKKVLLLFFTMITFSVSAQVKFTAETDRNSYALNETIQIAFEMNVDAFFFQFIGKRSRRFIITSHRKTSALKIASQGAHTNAANAQEINVFYFFEIQFLNAVNFTISSTILFAASFRPNVKLFLVSD